MGSELEQNQLPSEKMICDEDDWCGNLLDNLERTELINKWELIKKLKQEMDAENKRCYYTFAGNSKLLATCVSVQINDTLKDLSNRISEARQIMAEIVDYAVTGAYEIEADLVRFRFRGSGVLEVILQAEEDVRIVIVKEMENRDHKLLIPNPNNPSDRLPRKEGTFILSDPDLLTPGSAFIATIATYSCGFTPITFEVRQHRDLLIGVKDKRGVPYMGYGGTWIRRKDAACPDPKVHTDCIWYIHKDSVHEYVIFLDRLIRKVKKSDNAWLRNLFSVSSVTGAAAGVYSALLISNPIVGSFAAVLCAFMVSFLPGGVNNVVNYLEKLKVKIDEAEGIDDNNLASVNYRKHRIVTMYTTYLEEQISSFGGDPLFEPETHTYIGPEIDVEVVDNLEIEYGPAGYMGSAVIYSAALFS